MGALRALLFLLSIATALNTHALPQSVQDQLKNTQVIGSGRLKFLMLDVYDITLYGAGSTYNPAQPLALKIDYRVSIKGEAIADRAYAEIKKQPFNDAAKLKHWQKLMRQIFPDVENGVSLTGLKDNNGHTQFYRNETWIGEIKDPQFTQHFFAIWLADTTSEPKLRRQLLGAQ